MTGSEGNNEFCFPKTLNVLNVSRGGAERNVKGRGETKLVVFRGSSH